MRYVRPRAARPCALRGGAACQRVPGSYLSRYSYGSLQLIVQAITLAAALRLSAAGPSESTICSASSSSQSCLNPAIATGSEPGQPSVWEGLNETATRAQLVERLVRYCAMASTADSQAAHVPSSSGQWDLLRHIQEELQEPMAAGGADVSLTEQGYLIVSIPAAPGLEDVTTIAFFAHVDTAMDFNGVGVRPRVVENYDGRALELGAGTVLDPEEFPALRGKVGDTLVTASGDTLLGADDKTGVAVLVTLAEALATAPHARHGPVKIVLNPDEEIGHGMKELDLAALGARYGYTLDCEEAGGVQFETFSADKALVRITGVAIHPGWAKGKLVNALRLAGLFVGLLPGEGMSPETTEGREGFVHPTRMQGSAAAAEVELILRDFELEGLEAKREAVRAACAGVRRAEPRARVECTFAKQYRNMRYWLDQDMRAVEVAEAAMEAVGVVPKRSAIRGGTDGSQLTERGLPTPNLFAGWHNAHGPFEWASLDEMAASLRVTLAILSAFVDQAAKDKPLIGAVAVSEAADVAAAPQRRLPAGPLVIGYASWGQCDEAMLQAARDGVNVLVWFQINLQRNGSVPWVQGGPLEGSAAGFDCVADVASRLEAEGLQVAHLISIGGWNAPHVDTGFTAEEWWAALRQWNEAAATRPERGFWGFDGFDWDIEGNDTPAHPGNEFAAAELHLMGRLSQLAKAAGYIVAMAPPQSYLDSATSEFSLSLRHPPRAPWQPAFQYHGRNVYAALLALYGSTSMPRGSQAPPEAEAVPTFDFVSVQVYEGWSSANQEISDVEEGDDEAQVEVLTDLLRRAVRGWEVRFDAEPTLGIGARHVAVDPNHLVLGVANGWAGGDGGKFLFVEPSVLARVYERLRSEGTTIRGFMYWTIAEEGRRPEGTDRDVHMARDLCAVLPPLHCHPLK